MKKNIILYLFVFALLINVFTYMYFTNKEKSDNQRVEAMQATLKVSRDSIHAMQEKMVDADYFSLEQNSSAPEYFKGQDLGKLAIKIRDGIYAKNITPGGNPLVKYPQIGTRPFVINKIKILNTRWVVADFTNGTEWGEVILQYFVENNGDISFETVQTFLHTTPGY